MKALTAYRYRGVHRVNRFSRRVADIAEEIAADPPRRWVVRKLGPNVDLMNDGGYVFHNVMMSVEPRPDIRLTNRLAMLVEPPPSISNFPRLLDITGS